MSKFHPLFFLFPLALLLSCSPAEQQPESLVPVEGKPRPIAMAAAYQVFSVTGMHCSGCEMAITGNLKQMEGVQDATASFSKGKAWVALGEIGPSTAEIVQVIVDTGYEAGFGGEISEFPE